MLKTPSNRKLAGITAVLLLAAILRLWHLSELPPGLHDDEAYHLLQAQAILAGQSLPIFITGNNGYEPLVVYLAAIPLAILGPVTWAGRLAMAWAGIIGIATVIRCGNEMFRGRQIGIFAGLVLGTLFWNIDFSRFGSQPILAAVIGAGAMAALWHANRTGRWRAYLATGLCLGLGLYAYVAFRVFLAIPVGAFVFTWLERRLKSAPSQRAIFKGSLLAGGITLLVFAPLALFFIQHAVYFLTRFQETALPLNAQGSTPKMLLSNAQVTVGSLFFKGDANWLQNFSGRPALDGPQTIFFVLGLAALIWRWPQSQSWTLGLWLIVGFIPSILTEEAPHFGRMTFITPALALIAALGIELALKWLPRPIGPWTVGVALAFSIALTTYTYFDVWAGRPEVFTSYNGQLAWAGRALRSAPAGAELFAVPALHPSYAYPEFGSTLDYLIGPQAKAQLRTFSGQACLVAPSQTTSPTVYAIRADQDQTILPALQAVFPAGTYARLALLGDKPDTLVYQIPPGQVAQMPLAVSRPIVFGDLVHMLGYTLDRPSRKPDGPIRLTVVWKADSISKVPYKVFVHVIGPPQADGNIIYAQQDIQPCADSYPTWWWRPGDLISDTYSLPLSADIPAGVYSLHIGWYKDPNIDPTATRLTAVDANGQTLGDTVELEQIVVDTLGAPNHTAPSGAVFVPAAWRSRPMKIMHLGLDAAPSGKPPNAQGRWMVDSSSTSAGPASADTGKRCSVSGSYMPTPKR